MELRDYLRILRAHWIALAVLTLLGAAAAFGWSTLQPRVYTAQASGYVSGAVGDADNKGSSLIGNQLALAKVNSYIDIGSWRSVAEYAIDSLDLDVTPEALVARVTVSNPLDTVIIHVSADAPTPEEARDLAEAWTRGMVAQIDQLEGDGTAGSAPVTLIAGDSARLPSTPSSPNTRLNVALGALLGLAAGLGYAFVRRVLDRRVRDPRDIERETGVAVVGTLPLEKQLSDGRQVFSYDGASATASSAHAEAMRELRTNLQFMDVDNPPRVIVMTSSLPGDGKSTTAANLARSLAATGQRVVLIDADLRRPVLATTFGLAEGAGLSDVLAGRATVTDVAQPADARGNLLVLGAGRIPPNPSEVLGSQRMRDLLTSLGKEAIVIVDSPPTLPVTDAAVLTSAADGALIVVSAGKTTFEMLQRTVENITRANGRVLGIVLNRVPRRGAEAGYYGYQYTGTYSAADAGEDPPPASTAPVDDTAPDGLRRRHRTPVAP